jgi:GDP-mannose 6-dehydrogenase
VGVVAAGVLANDGHKVVGVDPNPVKVKLISEGMSPVIEDRVTDLIREGVSSGALCATQDARRAILGSELSLVCVGTPSQLNGSLDLTYVRRVCEDIGSALAEREGYLVVAIRSTILPGTMAATVIPTLEAHSGKTAGVDFGVCHNPEFLREGSAVYDYYHPPKTVIGQIDDRSGNVLEEIYRELGATFRVPIDVAEMVKYADNVWHAVKVCFANEIGTICKEQGIDSHEVMNIFCEDRMLNISPTYLKPGFAFGGSCLPKDVRALAYASRDLDVAAPLLGGVLASNDAHVQRVVDTVLDTGRRRVALIGLSFKPGSDDLRESPLVTLAEALIGRGLALRVCDPDVALGRLFGRNRAFIEERIPHVAQLMVDGLESAVRDAEVVIVGKRIEGVEDLPRLMGGQGTLVDLVGVDGLPNAVRPWAAGGAGPHQRLDAASVSVGRGFTPRRGGP